MLAAAILGAGLSKSKTHAIMSLAEWFDANRKTAGALPHLPDEEIVATLTGIAGIGA
jgi:3-methyladenine DNA glycosylase/8-oxoguanine DNA glycosylase